MVYEFFAQYQTPLSKLFLDILLVFALTSFIGLERESIRKFKRAEVGIRTYSLIGFLGYFATLTGIIMDFPIVLIALSGLILFEGISHFQRAKKGRLGITTEVSIVLAFLVGVIVGLGEYWAALLLAIFVTSILVSKRVMDSFAKSISEQDIITTIKFLIVAVVIFPLLP
ncbi:MAG TPA: MgtC/SapB family protein, partial [Candidatus Woesearchaeota archaeon]|nr:MgtC/SapB family protein [Candidatus Woesearchaeota archaeon]